MTNCARCLGLALAASLLLVAAGCGSKTPVPVYPTSGRLLINGQPAPGAIVGLHPTDGDFDQAGSRPAGRVQDDGSFVLATYGIADGVPAGEYIVTVFWPANPDGPDPGPDRLAEKYAIPEKSPLRITIHEGENELEPIRLDDVRVLKTRKGA